MRCVVQEYDVSLRSCDDTMQTFDDLVISPRVKEGGRVAGHPSNRIDELLPWAVAAKWVDEASAGDMPLAA